MKKTEWYQEIYPTIQENFFEINSLEDARKEERMDSKEYLRYSIEIKSLLLMNKWLTHNLDSASLKDFSYKISTLKDVFDHSKYKSFENDMKISSILHLYLEHGDEYIDDVVNMIDSSDVSLDNNLEEEERRVFSRGISKMKDFLQDEEMKFFVEKSGYTFPMEKVDPVIFSEELDARRLALHHLLDFQKKLEQYHTQDKKVK